MLVISSRNGDVGIEAAMDVLKRGGSALDAVEAGIRLVEANADDHSVGFGGYPNLLGEVELDAAMMNGAEPDQRRGWRAQGLQIPDFGGAQGDGETAARLPRRRRRGALCCGNGLRGGGFAHGLHRAKRGSVACRLTCRTARWRTCPELPDLWRYVEITTDPERTHGTTNFIAQDARGDIAVGVSTSGWAWKYPGRIGDSPIVGAGLYADNRYGAAACTGTGEMAIRAATAHSIVFYMKMGVPLVEAGQRAMTDLNDLGGRYLSGMNFIALDRDGNHAGFSNREGATYLCYADTMSAPEEVARQCVPLTQRWERVNG